MKSGHHRQSHMLTDALHTHCFRACALKIYTLNHQTQPPRHQKILRRLLYLNLFFHFLLFYLLHPHESRAIPGRRQIPRSLFQIFLFHDCWSMPSPMSPGAEASGRQHSPPSPQIEPKWRMRHFASRPGYRGDFFGISQMICPFAQASRKNSSVHGLREGPGRAFRCSVTQAFPPRCPRYDCMAWTVLASACITATPYYRS